MTLIVSSEISRGAGGVWGIALLSAGGIGSCQTYSPAANDQGSVTEVIEGQRDLESTFDHQRVG